MADSITYRTLIEPLKSAIDEGVASGPANNFDPHIFLKTIKANHKNLN